VETRDSRSLRSTHPSTISPALHAKIQAAAAQLARGQDEYRKYDPPPKQTSLVSPQPDIQSKAGPALKWANSYDKQAIREAYLSNPGGTGRSE
jgi:hypothetical protein